MDLKLDGKRALVTGSSSGIGSAIAKTLAAEGASVVVHGRNQDRVSQVVEAITDEDGDAIGVTADLADADVTESLAEQATVEFGGIDILVNNAGIYPNHDWWNTPPEEWSHLYTVNVLSAVRLIQQLGPQMQDAGWGRIINISSGEGTKPFAHMPDYAVTKAAMNNMTVSLSKALAKTGVTVNTVSPGLIATKEVKQWFTEEGKTRGWGTSWDEIEAVAVEEYLTVPIGRFGMPEDVATLVAFIASPLAGYIHGANYRIDGGSTDSVN